MHIDETNLGPLDLIAKGALGESGHQIHDLRGMAAWEVGPYEFP